jgi:hypothetical protein
MEFLFDERRGLTATGHSPFTGDSGGAHSFTHSSEYRTTIKSIPPVKAVSIN